LEDNGFKVDAFTEALVALSNFKADFYDLVILDIKMPDMNGFELYKEMRFYSLQQLKHIMRIWNSCFQHLIKSNLL
jgi:DNA-binding response OmpR family regulator